MEQSMWISPPMQCADHLLSPLMLESLSASLLAVSLEN